MGFDAMFFGRMDGAERDQRQMRREMEWVQEPMTEESYGSDYKLLFHMLTDIYVYPPGFNFDIAGPTDAPYEDDKKYYDTYNAQQEAEKLDGWLDGLAAKYPETDNLFVLFGMDFQYMDAHDNYRSMDRMIDYFNAHYADKWLFQYSTPSHYVDAVAASNYTFTTKQDDLFPYGDTSPSWWTGYYTSRANAKAYVRRGSHTLRALNQLYSELALDQNADPDTLEAALTGSKKLLDAMGIFQHHDAVSGTARQDVADDYVYRLGEALEANMGTYGKIIDDMVSKLTQRTSDNTWEMCARSNGTWVDCPVKDLSLIHI